MRGRKTSERPSAGVWTEYSTGGGGATAKWHARAAWHVKPEGMRMKMRAMTCVRREGIHVGHLLGSSADGETKRRVRTGQVRMDRSWPSHSEWSRREMAMLVLLTPIGRGRA